MIEYIVAQSPDHRVLHRASKELRNGNLVCLPTDTNWVIVCDPFSVKGVNNLYGVRKEMPEKHFSVLCDTVSRANELASIPDQAFKLIRNKIPGNYTFIFEAKKKIFKALKASKKDREIGIRFPPSKLISELIEIHGEVLLSANVTHEMLEIEDEKIEIYPYLIDDSLGHLFSMIIDPEVTNFAGSSSIVSFINDQVEVLREGAGDIRSFV